MRSFGDLEKALARTRNQFQALASSKSGILSRSFDLYFEGLRILSSLLKEGDSEIQPVIVLAGAVRRVFASYVLLESGLPQEAQMILRNGLEHMLVAIELIHDERARSKWAETAQNSEEGTEGQYYFKPRKCFQRITKDDSAYSELDRSLADHIYKEWKKISNQTIHLHSKQQISALLAEKGSFQFLGLKETGKYARDFKTLAGIIFDIVGIMLGMVRFREAVGSSHVFHGLYYTVHKECLIGEKAFLEVGTKRELRDALARLGLTLNVSGLPDTARLEHVVVDMSNPEDPRLIVTYAEDSEKAAWE